MRMRRITKKIKENPALLSDAYIHSKVEAEHLFDAGFPSLNETLIRAEAKSTLPEEAWRQFRDQSLDEQEQRTDTLRQDGLHHSENYCLHTNALRLWA